MDRCMEVWFRGVIPCMSSQTTWRKKKSKKIVAREATIFLLFSNDVIPPTHQASQIFSLSYPELSILTFFANFKNTIGFGR